MLWLEGRSVSETVEALPALLAALPVSELLVADIDRLDEITSAAATSDVRVRPLRECTCRQDFGRIILDVCNQSASVDGRPVALTATEFQVLRVLAAHRDSVVTREQLVSAVWRNNGWHGDGHAVEVHVANLRRKLGESGKQNKGPKFLRTIRGVGYRFEPSPG